MFGFFRVAAVVPEMRVADVGFNTDRIVDMVREATKVSASVIVFPELCLTGFTCGDLFYQKRLLDWAERSLAKIALAVKDHNQLVIVGLPFRYQDALYDTAALLQDGKVVGLVPKSVINGSRECSAGRYFASGAAIKQTNVALLGQDEPVPFGTDLLFSCGTELKFAIELGEDFWVPRPPSSVLAEAGARLIFNLSASYELLGKADFRINLLAAQSARCFAGYVYCSSGPMESSTSSVFGGHAVIADNGKIVQESSRFGRAHNIIYADLDVERLTTLRRVDGLFPDITNSEFRMVKLNNLTGSPDLRYAEITQTPFVPTDIEERQANCGEIITIQASALAKRVEHVNAKRVIIGASGGLDSTLALLVATQSMLLLNRPSSDIMAVTMPGFGTTPETYNNVIALCKALGTELVEIGIKESCLQHFEAIEHDPNVHNTLYENVQARERTQILMSLANQEDGLVVGTGDLTEIALGWSTYNGDHMAMYNINCSVPKTILPYLLDYFCNAAEHSALNEVIERIIQTPASPELLPPQSADGATLKSEDVLGPYALHDFFLYHFVRYGATPEKLKYLADYAFNQIYSKEVITTTLSTFLTRFFAQQYKRNCAPDGPRIGTVSLSSHGAWLMPSDASANCWLSSELPSGVRAGRNRTDWNEYSKRKEEV